MKRRKFFLLPVLLLAVFLSGCKAPGRDAASNKKEPEEAVLAVAEPDAVIDDSWKKDGFACQKSFGYMSSAGNFQEIRYLELEETVPEFSYSDSESKVAYLRDTRYELVIYTVSGGMRYFLERREADEETPRRIELFTDGELPSGGHVLSMDVVSESDIAILFLTKEQEYKIFHLDGDGKIFSSNDLADCFRKQEITADELRYYWHCDEVGDSYVISHKKLLLYIYDSAGELLMTHKLSQDFRETVPCVCRAPDGSLLFAFVSGQETAIVRFDLEVKAPQTLATLPMGGVWQCCMEKDGRFLLVDETKVLLWNGISGEITSLFSHYGSDIKSYITIQHAAATPDGRLLLHVEGSNGERDKLYVLSDQVAEETEGITLVNFTRDTYVQLSASLFNRGQEEKEKIIYSKVNSYGEDLEDEWTRLMASFAAGKGPDMLCIDATDRHLDTLWEKGIIADLDGWVSQETLDQIYPGLRACGVIDGKMAGVSLTLNAPCMIITSADFCPSGYWSQQDALANVRENPDMDSIYLGDSWDGSNTSQNLDFLVLKHLENSPFIDWESGESHFESREFQDVLEICKKYGGAEEYRDEMSAEKRYKIFADLLKDKRGMSYKIDVFHFGHYRDYKDLFDDSTRFTGYPGQTGYTGYWADVTLIVVNARTKYSETIAKFLEYYLSEESLSKYTFPAVSRADLYKAYYLKNINVGTNSYTEEELDGYINDVLYKAGPVSRYNRAVADIITQEAEIFFAGERDVATTADVIDNRVQLYLNERK